MEKLTGGTKLPASKWNLDGEFSAGHCQMQVLMIPQGLYDPVAESWR